MESSTIAILLAAIGILKGKDVWEYLKDRNKNKNSGNEKVIKIYEDQIIELKIQVKELKEKVDELTERLEKKIFKSRGKRNELNS